MPRKTGETRNIDFADERERELFTTFELGEEVMRFCKDTPIGVYLKHRIDQVTRQAEVDALQIDPDGFGGWFRARRKLRAIRQQAAVAKLLNNWLAEAIMEGRRAESELETYRD